MKALTFALVFFGVATSSGADRGTAGMPHLTRTSGSCSDLQGYEDTGISDGRYFGMGGKRSRLCKLINLGSGCNIYTVVGSIGGETGKCKSGDRQLGTNPTIGGPVTSCASKSCRINDNQNLNPRPAQGGSAK